MGASLSHKQSSNLEVKEDALLDTLRSKLGPPLFMLAMQKDNISQLFKLLRQLFDAFDENKDGIVDKNELSVLQTLGLLSADAFERLKNWTTNTKGELIFGELCTFYADESTRDEKAGSTSSSAATASTSDDKEEQDIPERWRQVLAPIAFRLAMKHEDAKRIFLILRRVFDAFDVDANGLVDKTDLKTLQDVNFLTDAEVDALMAWPTATPGSLTFHDFVAYFAAQTLDEYHTTAGTQPTQAQQLAPLFLRLAGERDNIWRLYHLLSRIFKVLDTDHDNYINKSDLNNLAQDGFFGPDEIASLESFNTQTPGKISLREFIAWLVDQAVSNPGSM